MKTNTKNLTQIFKQKLTRLTKKQLILIGGASALGIATLTAIVAVTAIPKRQKIESAEVKYRNDNKEILAKNETNILISDETKVNNALAQYNAFSTEIKDKLVVEKTLLDKLLSKITELKQSSETTNPTPGPVEPKEDKTAEDNFRVKHQIIIDKTLSELNLNDKAYVNAALADYDSLTESAKSNLTSEKINLDTKLQRIKELEDSNNTQNSLKQAEDNYKSKHQVILSKLLQDIQVSDKELVQAALSDYELLHDDVKANLTLQKQNLDDKDNRIKELEKVDQEKANNDNKNNASSDGDTLTQKPTEPDPNKPVETKPTQPPAEQQKLKLVLDLKSRDSGNGANADIQIYVDGWTKQQMINYLGYLKHYGTQEEINTWIEKMTALYHTGNFNGHNQKWKIILFKSDTAVAVGHDNPVVGSVSPHIRTNDLNYTENGKNIQIRTDVFISTTNWKFNTDNRFKKAFEYTIYKYHWPNYEYKNGEVKPDFSNVETETVTSA